MTAAEALHRYHAAETRLAEVEAAIEAWARRTEWERRNYVERYDRGSDTPPVPDAPLLDLLLERDALQAESFKVFTEARRLG